MDGIGPQAMIDPEIPGGGIGGRAPAVSGIPGREMPGVAAVLGVPLGAAPAAPAGAATEGIWPSVKGWFQKQDPNFWSILLGSLAQSAPPGSWQHQLGGTASQIGRGQIMAKAMEKEREERRMMWEDLKTMIGGYAGTRPEGQRMDPFASQESKEGRSEFSDRFMMGGSM